MSNHTNAQAMFLHSNLTLLRKRHHISQEAMADKLGISRSTYKNYEQPGRIPPLKVVVGISSCLGIAIDTLIKVNLSEYSDYQLQRLKNGNESFITGDNLRVLAITVTEKNKDNIEVVSIKAKAGYTQGFADIEFIKDLPRFQLPFLSQNRKYRAFQIESDSMLPIKDKSWVIGEYVDNFREIQDGSACIILTVDEGAVFKLVYKQEKGLLFVSKNSLYKPYEKAWGEIREAWKFKLVISPDFPE